MGNQEQNELGRKKFLWIFQWVEEKERTKGKIKTIRDHKYSEIEETISKNSQAHIANHSAIYIIDQRMTLWTKINNFLFIAILFLSWGIFIFNTFSKNPIK